jgi:hypothetical protein
MAIALLLIAPLLAAGAAASDDAPAPVALLHRAEEAFSAGVRARARPEEARRHFRAALADYEALRRGGASSPDLYRNLGNAALLSDDLPAAILAYRRGLRLEPGDRVLQDNLAIVRNRVPYPPETMERPAADQWPAWFPQLSSDWLLAIALALYTAGCVLGTCWLVGRRLWLRGSAVVALAGATVLGLCWWAGYWKTAEETAHPVVVIAVDSVPLYTGNGRSYPGHRVLPVLRRGMEGRLQFIRNDWLQVEFPGGHVGWLPRASVLVDQ